MAEPARPMPAAAAARKPPAEVTGWKAALAAAWQGFSEPSALAFRTFLLSLAATLGLCLWYFSPATLAGPMGAFLPRSALDAEGFATRAALHTGHVPPDRPRLILLGTSAVAQSIGTGTLLKDRIEAGTGVAWDVVNLATPQQSPTDQFALAETALASQTAESPLALVAVGFGAQRLRWTTEQTLGFHAMGRLGVAHTWADDEARLLGGTVPARTGFYIPDNWSFVLLNGSEALMRLLLQTPARQDTDQYVHGASMESAARHALIGRETRSGVARMDAYLDQIARLADRVALVPNTRMVLIEETISPALVAEQRLSGPRAELETALAQRGPGRMPPFWPIVAEADLTAADYFDELHVLSGTPQDRVQVALSDRVIAEWNAYDGAPDGN